MILFYYDHAGVSVIRLLDLYAPDMLYITVQRYYNEELVIQSYTHVNNTFNLWYLMN